MPVLRFDADDLNQLVGDSIPVSRLADRLPMIGGDLDKVEGSQITIEFFPNRPDLLSVEGVARAARAFFDVKRGLPSYRVAKSDEEVRIDASVTRVRPYVAFARVDGLKLDADRLTQLIELQERLTMGLGRRRKKVAIGIHDAKDVRGPYRYRAVGLEEVRFVPLGYSREMTPKQILKDHEKGRLYAHLVQGHDKVPMIEDRDGHVLSFPPVINGVRTQLTEDTRDVLVDVTGPDRAAVYGTLNIVVSALAERGGRIHSLRHVQGSKAWHAPDLAPTAWTLERAYADSLLGRRFTDADLRKGLGRMAHGIQSLNPKTAKVHVGAWRVDLLHPVDLVEEVAIGHGFDAFESALPERALFASQRATSRLANKARTLLVGQGYTEVVTLTLTGRRDHFEAMGTPEEPVVAVTNPVTQDHAILRARLLPSLLGILRANKQNPLPQAIFEVGTVVPAVRPGAAPRNQLRAAAVRVASRAGFSDAKSAAEAFVRDAGLEASSAEGTIGGLIEGRTALLKRGRDVIGYYGEVAPATLEAFELEAPAFAFEVVLDSESATPA